MKPTTIHFKSYRNFSGEEKLKIKPITLIVGKNSSGKSSILKLLSMFEESFRGMVDSSSISLVNKDVTFAYSYKDVPHNGNSVGLELGASFDNVDVNASFVLDKDRLKIYEYTVTKEDVTYRLVWSKDEGVYKDIESGITYPEDSFSGLCNEDFLNNIDSRFNAHYVTDYIGPFRATPERNYYPDRSVLKEDIVGYRGENSCITLCKNPDVAAKVSKWYEENFKCRLTIEKQGDGARQLCFRKMGSPDYPVNIVDEGEGMSQVLPIIVSCMVANEHIVNVIEEPELHLHPSAHASLAVLMARTAKDSNKTYVVESHSPNFLLGLRAAVVDKDCPIKSDDVVIYYIDEDEDGVYTREITIEPDGMLSDWPTDVFNESYELMKIIAKNAKKQNGYDCHY